MSIIRRRKISMASPSRVYRIIAKLMIEKGANNCSPPDHDLGPATVLESLSRVALSSAQATCYYIQHNIRKTGDSYLLVALCENRGQLPISCTLKYLVTIISWPA